MYVITRTARRTDGAAGTVTRLVAVGGQFLFPSVEAETLASSLAAGDRSVYPRPRYACRQQYLPACDRHPEHVPGCTDCTDAVSAWLEEIRESASDRTNPPVVNAS